MKNTLKIENFLIIDSAEIEIKKFTVFIGPQASGKSIVAKLLYLFYHLPDIAFSIANSGGKKRKLNETMIKTFREIFPQYAWNEKKFTICFSTDMGEISFTHMSQKALTFHVSNDYDKMLKKLFSIASREPDSNQMEIGQIERLKKIHETVYNTNWGFLTYAGGSTFIPAGRSFYASLENNVFSFLSNNIHIDYFLKEFGMYYQNAKQMLSRFSLHKANSADVFTDICKKYIGGTYFQRQQKDYIRHTKNKLEIEVKDASSGQQELLPILFVMSLIRNGMFLIEEPETHIFPSSQSEIIKQIVSLQVRNSAARSFLFTTHSPYVLTTLNNLAYAGVLESKFSNEDREDLLKKLDKIYPAQERIAKDCLSSYYFDNGNITPITPDSETGLIDAQKLDEISNITNDKFSDLLALSLDNEKSVLEE